MEARIEALQTSGGAVLEVARVTGTATELEGLRQVLSGPVAPPVGAHGVVDRDGRSLRWFVRWEDKPEAPSLFHLVFRIAGADALVTPALKQGRVEVRVACRSADDLQRLYGEVERTYGRRWDVRLVRIGALRDRAPTMPDDDRELLAHALQAGYYDEPKRVGVRELGESLGWSKTALARRLRVLERRAVEQLAGQH